MHLLERLKSKTVVTTNAEEQEELTFNAGANSKWYNQFRRQHGSILQASTYGSICNPAIIVSGFHQNKFKSYAYKKCRHTKYACTWIL